MIILENIDNEYKLHSDNYLKSNVGVYRFFVNEEILNLILDKLGLDKTIYNEIEKLTFKDKNRNFEDYYCVYVGQTKSKLGFYGRIIKSHLNGSRRTSTLKKSLKGVLKNKKVDLNDIYNNKSLFVIIPKNDKSKINDLEKKEIKSHENKDYYRVLNLDNNKQNSKGGKHYSTGQLIKKLRK